MVEYPQQGFFMFFTKQRTEVIHKLMSSGNIMRDLMAVTFFFLLYVLPLHEWFYVSLFWPLLNSPW